MLLLYSLRNKIQEFLQQHNSVPVDNALLDINCLFRLNHFDCYDYLAIKRFYALLNSLPEPENIRIGSSFIVGFFDFPYFRTNCIDHEFVIFDNVIKHYSNVSEFLLDLPLLLEVPAKKYHFVDLVFVYTLLSLQSLSYTKIKFSGISRQLPINLIKDLDLLLYFFYQFPFRNDFVVYLYSKELLTQFLSVDWVECLIGLFGDSYSDDTLLDIILKVQQYLVNNYFDRSKFQLFLKFGGNIDKLFKSYDVIKVDFIDQLSDLSLRVAPLELVVDFRYTPSWVLKQVKFFPDDQELENFVMILKEDIDACVTGIGRLVQRWPRVCFKNIEHLADLLWFDSEQSQKIEAYLVKYFPGCFFLDK